MTPYSIYGRRKTTMNHAFAAAIAPCDQYDPERVMEDIKLLGQDPTNDLSCVYCDSPAETWDHVFATVKASIFSGAGHRLGNLLPCCKPCNSRKGNRSWDAFILSREVDSPERTARITRISRFIEVFFFKDEVPTSSPEYLRLVEIRNQVFDLMREADKIALTIRGQAKLEAVGANLTPPPPSSGSAPS
jgi:hypothetical protein